MLVQWVADYELSNIFENEWQSSGYHSRELDECSFNFNVPTKCRI